MQILADYDRGIEGLTIRVIDDIEDLNFIRYCNFDLTVLSITRTTSD